MIVREKGDLFANQHEAYAHGVSNLGKMGKGIAVKFKKMYPEMFQIYRSLCHEDELKPGDSYFFRADDGRPSVFNLVTQDSLKEAQAVYLEESIEKMYVQARQEDITDIAMPMIGCGLGKLSVDRLIGALNAFARDSYHHVTVYDHVSENVPDNVFDTPPDIKSGNKHIAYAARR